MAITVEEIIAALESWAPKKLAEDWDNVGLQLGSLKKQVKHLGVCLDLTPETLAQALTQKIDCLVTHHPFFFKSTKQICWDTWPGKAVKTLAEKDISLIACHTNLDSAKEGVSDVLGEALHLKVERALLPAKATKLFLITTYVPKGYEEKVREILLKEGAGQRGKYSGCSFATEGIGSFYPKEEAKPYRGKVGKLNLVSGTKMEFLVPEFLLARVIAKIKEVHPYEEVPIDVWPTEAYDYRYGLGRIGELPLEYTLYELAQKLSQLLNSQAIFMVGDPKQLVKRVALCGGAGGDFFENALSLGAEVYITAEVKYHQAREAEARGLSLISVGHFESESLIVPKMAEFFQKMANSKGEELQITMLKEKNPFIPLF
ncbi:protein of unknown function DUF34 [Thermodesulfatator indicus DSM 15286]|uniref:GTP cyclohydrolase 1 type 2 homolog n=1 Tax=Thermodesulfatator indicus (strain DSM 15286 / JCM 11887 / CIR29812) TaxID=667014 RepID=F8A8B4_THEID|nr:Nif3-like dinuclear metal center hexameric protein [Thermodesulfatator indicus]AEH43918.1 protein of unknown function DUF34 [Thermodesulfatator indicus DSM 15286]